MMSLKFYMLQIRQILMVFLVQNSLAVDSAVPIAGVVLHIYGPGKSGVQNHVPILTWNDFSQTEWHTLQGGGEGGERGREEC